MLLNNNNNTTDNNKYNFKFGLFCSGLWILGCCFMFPRNGKIQILFIRLNMPFNQKHIAKASTQLHQEEILLHSI